MATRLNTKKLKTYKNNLRVSPKSQKAMPWSKKLRTIKIKSGFRTRINNVGSNT
jgi:hypothetical protein